MENLRFIIFISVGHRHWYTLKTFSMSKSRVHIALHLLISVDITTKIEMFDLADIFLSKCALNSL